MLRVSTAIALIFLSTTFAKSMIRKTTSDVPSKNRGEGKLALQYFKGLGIWKNGERDLGPALLDRVAPCWKRSKSLKNKWMSIYEKRGDHEVVFLDILDQAWQGEEGTATMIPFRTGMSMGTLEAGELILERLVPSEIGESFGRYRTAVYTIQKNTTDQRIHADFQASCPSKRANIIVLDLDTIALTEWRNQPGDVLELRIRVQPRRQYFATGRGNKGKRVPVVKRAIGIVLHFSLPEEEISSHLLNTVRHLQTLDHVTGDDRRSYTNDALLSNDLLDVVRSLDAYHGQSQTAIRQKRSPTLRRLRSHGIRTENTRPPPTASPNYPKTCRRTPHRLSRRIYDNMGIVDPKYEHENFDIGECTGDCPFPINSANLNATNHAVAIFTAMPSNPELTVCCVPVSYAKLFYTGRFEGYYLRQRKFENFIAKSCACR